jgi:hypothetical protein
MSSISHTHNDGDDYVTEITETETQTAKTRGHLPYRVARLSLEDGQLANDGTDTETVTVEIVDGLAVARGETPAVLDAESGTLTLSIDGAEVSVPIDGGTGTKAVTTTKSGGSSIEVETVGFDGGPIDADRVSIEVIQA